MSGKAQPTISTYFKAITPSPSKRRGRHDSPIDLTREDIEPELPRKRPRLTSPHESFSRHSTASTSTVDAWRYSPDKQSTQGKGPSQPRNKRDEERLTAFKKSLLQDNNRFLKRDTPVQNKDGVDEDVEMDSDPFKSLTDMFTHKQKQKVGARKQAAGSASDVGPNGQPYTPLERQILQLKKDNQGTVLMVEVGYKYKFFGEDAKVAAKELGMVAFTDRNFTVASVPVHRRDIYVKKLLSAGYRVGIVEQVETAALKKVGDNRNTPFERKLTKLFTAATYVDGLDSVDIIEERGASSVFMCLVEEEAKKGNNTFVSIGMITICPSTGDVEWDDFDDTIMRLELETRLIHIQPAELLISKNSLTTPTRKMLTHFTNSSIAGHKIHIEDLPSTISHADALDRVSDFYNNKTDCPGGSESFHSGKLMAEIIDLPKRVLVALAHAIEYLSSFGIAAAFSETRFFTKFTTKADMKLAANTLINLEIFRNEDDGTEKGSLIWVLDKTKTKFGARLLRHWVGHPLVDQRLLKERTDAVEEILESTSEELLTFRTLLKGLPDLARGLSRIQYGQCTLKELSIILPAFNKIANAFEDLDSYSAEGPFKSPVLNQVIFSLPKLREPMKYIMNSLNMKMLERGDKTNLWTDWDRHPDMEGSKMCLQTIDLELEAELKAVRKQLRMPSLVWTTVALDDYLVEVKRADNRPIPDNWILHSKTKFLARYQPPSVREKVQEQAQYRETLESQANKAYRDFLTEISEKHYAVLRDAVTKLATADCLLSLAQVALQKDYTRPTFTDDETLEIIDGRHPVIEAFSDDPYVANSIELGGGASWTKIITGPNMGGKSSCVRMIAIIALMAQIGSYVPATSVKMGLLDTILTRMGASDDLARGRSTFMVEMSETSQILQTATSRSLVILDELGRGTSTFDGMAIADATLQHITERIKSKTLFITHYPLLATKLQSKYPKYIQNLHMGYEAESRIDGSRQITFLYRLIPGLATESFGIECARMAKVPEAIMASASERAAQMQKAVERRAFRNMLQRSPSYIQQLLQSSGTPGEVAIEDLRTIMELLRLSNK